MPAEPERHVEKLLRAYSKRRREEGARIPELHPATRQMLRDEAARTWRPGTAEAEAGEKFGGSLWLRLGFAGAVGVVIVAAVVFMRPEKKGFDLAKSEKPRGTTLRSEPASADRLAEARQNAPATSKPQEKLEREMLRRTDTPKLAVTATSSSSAATPALTVVVADSGGTAAKDSADWRTQLRFSAPAERKLLASYEGSAGISRNRAPESITRPEPLYGLYTELQTATVQLAETSQASKSIEEMTRQLVEAARVQRASDQKVPGQLPPARQVASQAGPQAAPPPLATQRARFRQPTGPPEQPQVMQSFAVEQAGRQIRIIEDDGSVYEGQLTGEPVPVRFEAAKAEKAAAAEGVMKAKSALALRDQAAPAAAPAAMETVSFVALGFNRTLGQAVVFRGNFESTPAPGGQARADEAKLGQTQVQRLGAAAPANQSGAGGVGGAQSNAVLYFGGSFSGAATVGQAQTQGGAAVGGIRGKATVGGSVEVEIRAVPAQP